MARTALVIGGGLMGVTSAWYLAERGLRVTVVERREATALDTSFANGGLITPSQSDPWNGPGTALNLVKWLGREDSPLLLRPGALPGMWHWGLRFLTSSRMKRWWPATEANLRLGLYSAASLRRLREQLDLDYDHLSRGTLKLFRDEESLEHSDVLARSLAPLGLKHRALDPEQAVGLEPLLAPIRDELAGAIHYPYDESGDAHRFTRLMESKAREAGVIFRFDTEVTGFKQRSNRVEALSCGEEELQADVYVLAAASHTPALAAPLGLKLPIYPVKGYSLTLSAPDLESALSVPLVDFEHKIVITPLGKRLRVAGTAEFAGFDSRENPRRSAGILKHTLRLLPQLAGRVKPAEVLHWNGLRPMTPDGPPILGATPYPNLFLNTGHGPLGFTLAAGSSRVVSDLAAGREPEISLAGYSLDRFS
ncbi:MAG TPA: D-amino acid dehydrogenase [Gammaproteobacteria bacterium]|jgi:D-amino-acid dehydrogenase